MAAAQQHEPPLARPRSVTIVIWGVFFLGAANLWRAVGFMRGAKLLQNLDSKPAPELLAILALLWTVLLIASAAILEREWPPIRFYMPLLLLCYGLYQVGLLLFFARSETARLGWPVPALLYLLAVFYATWALNRPAARRFLEVGRKRI